MPLYETFRRLLADEIPVALATVIAGPVGVGAKLVVTSDGPADGRLPSTELERAVGGDAMRLLRDERSETVRYDIPDGAFDVFIDAYPAPAQLIVVGASGAAGPLTTFGKALGYRVIITDARSAFADAARFPDADRVVKGWPQDVLPSLRLDESTYVVLLSHDPKFDEPTLDVVLPSRVPYIGAIGSRKTQQERMERLRARGHTQEQLERLYGPVGLDLGGRTTEETALAILAEITAVRHGKGAGFMRQKLREPAAR